MKVTDVVYTYDGKILGADDWTEDVVSLGSGGGYEWADLYAFWSPSERRYFWLSGSGCSCNSIGDDVSTKDDFENGDRAALEAALRRFAAEHTYYVNATELLDAIEKLRDFQETYA